MVHLPSVSLGWLVGEPEQATPPVALLDALRDTPQPLSALADAFDLSRQTVYRMVTPAIGAHLVTADDDAYCCTGLGGVIVHQFESITARSGVDAGDLAVVCDSTARLKLLRQLHAGPQTKADLARDADAPSRTTVHRASQQFHTRGWVTTTNTGALELTARGKAILETTDELTAALDIAHQYAVFLASLDTRMETIPLTGLAGARQIVETNLSTGTTESVLEELVEAGPDDVRTLQSSVSTRLADIYDPVIRSQARNQILITPRVLTSLPTEGRYSEHVRRGLTSRNVSVRVVPNEAVFPVNMAIHDTETVILGPPDTSWFIEHDEMLYTGAVVSSNPALVEWALELWEQYNEASVTISQQVIQSLLARIRTTVGRGGTSSPDAGRGD